MLNCSSIIQKRLESKAQRQHWVAVSSWMYHYSSAQDTTKNSTGRQQYSTKQWMMVDVSAWCQVAGFDSGYQQSTLSCSIRQQVTVFSIQVRELRPMLSVRSLRSTVSSQLHRSSVEISFNILDIDSFNIFYCIDTVRNVVSLCHMKIPLHLKSIGDATEG